MGECCLLESIDLNSWESVHSEMEENGFNDSPISSYMRYILNTMSSQENNEDHLSLDHILEVFNNDKIFNKYKTKSLHDTVSFSWKGYSSCLVSTLSEFLHEDYYDIRFMELSGGSNVHISDEIIKIYEYIRSVGERVSVYDNDVANEFLNKYFDVSKNYIFNTQNTSINSLLFRKSKTLEALNCIGKIPWKSEEMNDEEIKKMQDKGYALYSICSPYACDALQRAIYNIVDNQSRLNRILDLKKLRTEIFIDRMVRSFTRFTSYNQFTNYRVTLNRHSGNLISLPYNELSSIEEIKPLRLFEKIADNIENRIKDLKNEISPEKLLIKVAIIGHTEQSYNPIEKNCDNRELADLLRVVMDWYVNNHKSENYIPIDLRIKNYVNKGDVVNSIRWSERNSPVPAYKINGSIGQIEVVETDYFSEFYFSKQQLKRLCQDNDIMFIIDCPWLTDESYELKNDGLLDFYCSSIQRKTLRNYDRDVLDSYRRTTMQELDTQFNRITSSDSVKAGDISRVFKDDILRELEKYIKNFPENQRKDVYIFTSERDGVDYSFLASYPSTREEIYGGKQFTISHFCNKKLSKLDVGTSDINIKIRLWSVLKYISVSYAFITLREEIQSLFPNVVSPENYFKLLRSIIIVLHLHSNLDEIDISVRFSEGIGFLKEIFDNDINKVEEIKKNIYNKIYPFIHTLYKDGVFSDKNDFGDSVIKTGFEMNVKSATQDVNTLLFIYFYCLRRKEKNTESFVLNWNDSYNPEALDLSTETHCFRDKRLYYALFGRLMRGSEINIGMIHSLRLAENIFDTNNMKKHVLKNTVEACKKMNYTKSRIYLNALKALEEI